MEIGELVMVWDNKYSRWERARIENIRHDVPCCEGTELAHIHGIVFDVTFLHDGRFSKGHLPHVLKAGENS